MADNAKMIPIRAVVDRDLPQSRRRIGAVGFDIDCPFCGGHYKLNVNERKNVWRCNKCGEGGSALSLHMRLAGRSLSQAQADFSEITGVFVEPEEEKPVVQSALIRNTVNATLQEALRLTDNAKKGKIVDDLHRRGLSDEAIVERGYRAFGGLSEDAASRLQDVFTGLLLRNRNMQTVLDAHPGRVPGFYGTGTAEDGYQIVRRKRSGILIPVKGINGFISGFQIRHFRPDWMPEKDFRKYTWLSSSEKPEGVGVTDISQIHHVGFCESNGCVSVPEVVYLTEGALKADVASHLSGWPFIAVMGVNNTRQLENELQILKEAGCRELRLAYDMDFYTNANVKKAMEKTIHIVKNSGLKLRVVEWDPQYKGIDDWLLSQKRNT